MEVVDSPMSSQPHFKEEGGGSQRVSFRQDVVFNADNNNKSGRSGTMSTYSDDSTSNQRRSYSKLRSSLTREQVNRDPYTYYQVTRNLGSGSMGDVQLVQKRADKIGGSARRDLRVPKGQNCFPLLGRFLRSCTENNSDAVSDVSSSSRHSTKFISLEKDQDENGTAASTTRGFEDSLFFRQASTASSLTGSTSQATTQPITYAMKSILLIQVTQKQYIDELRNEIAILKDLDHPNIVRAIETFEYRGKISIIMELCSGGDLYTRDPYSESDAARIVTSILSAISYMHSRNVVHRDLKYENVLFVNTSPLSQVKLIDFGLSKVYVGENKMTDMSGTIYTMAPEVLMGEHTEKADMWSIGVMAFMLLSSAMPFYGVNRVKVIKRILNNKYAFRGRRWTTISPEAKDFIRKILVPDPEERWDPETALQSEWLQSKAGGETNGRGVGGATQWTLSAEEEEMVRVTLLKYARYPKLKKMALMVVAHKSSSDEIGILRHLFEKYDSRHDGSIWFDEFCNSMKGLGHSNEELRATFDALDLSGSGKVSYTEFVAATIEAHGPIGETRLAEAFDRLDSDDSGFITAENLVDILGKDVPTEEIHAIIAQADLTKDKRVSYSEFMALWEVDEVPDTDQNQKYLGNELSSLSLDESEASDAEAAGARAEFLKEKHLQNTLHTWAIEMQLPAHEFAKGCSFLHQVALGDQAILEKTLEERPKLANFRDYDRRTPLHIAASEGHVEICSLLIKKGARVNRSDRWGGYPLDDAHRHGRSDVVNLLRLHGAKFGNTSQTANLITAASEGNVNEVKTLLEFGSMDLNQGDYDARTALHLAANEGHLEVVKLLVDAGADINVKDRWGDRPLDDARKAKKNASAIVKLLGGVVDDSLTDQQTAKMHELRHEDLKESTTVVKSDEGMTVLSVQEFAMGCTVLHQAALGNKLVLEKIFLERPALVNFRDYDRRTAMHIAAAEGQLGICKYLVRKGARINRCDRWGGCPLDDAHRHKHADVVKYLRSQGAKFGSTSQVTNFITAASEGDKEEVQAFLDFGSVDVNQGDYDMRTALHLAVCSGKLEIVEMLCEAGANVNVEDRWGHRPLDDSKNAKENSDAILKLLLKNGAKSRNLLTNVTTVLSSMFSK